MYKTLLVLSYCVTLCFCHAYYEQPNPDAAKGTCLTNEFNIGTLKTGESRQIPGECTKITCSDNGSIFYESCGVAVNEKGETCAIDFSKPHPDCCWTC